MRIEALKKERLAEFLDYCRKYGKEHDESYTNDEDLKDFEIGEENPTCLLLNEEEELIGAASLLLDSYHKRGRKSRFRIFHTIRPSVDAYKLMLDCLLPQVAEVDRLILFVKEEREHMPELVKALGFVIERYTWVLEKENDNAPEPEFPEGFELRPIRFGSEEWAWCHVRNIAFAKLLGSETPMTENMIRDMADEDDYMEGGMQLLWHGEQPVGVIRTVRDTEEDSTVIGPLALLPEYQGRGLGRSLLRAGVVFGKNAGIGKTALCVNAENSRAAELYFKEGFKKLEVVVCYNLKLK